MPTLFFHSQDRKSTQILIFKIPHTIASNIAMTHASSPHQDHSNHANRVQHTGPLKDGNYRMSCQAHVNHYLTSVSNPTTGQNATGVKWCNVLWKLRYNTSDCSYTIFHRDSTNTLDLLESRRESGTNIIVYPSTGNPNQKWKFSETSTGWVTGYLPIFMRTGLTW